MSLKKQFDFNEVDYVNKLRVEFAKEYENVNKNIVENKEAKRDVIVEEMYKHFKGKCYVVLAVATHTETGEDMVICQEVNYGGTHKFWCIPKSNFLEKVDKEKYPDAEQEYRFELRSNNYINGLDCEPS